MLLEKRKKILYVGGFEMPDGNAAAQRVLAIAKTLQEKYDVHFLGVTHGQASSGRIAGFEYENLPYPITRIEWIQHLCGSKELKRLIEEKPDIVIAYNFPAIGLYRLLRYCKGKGIKIVGDITEWYHSYNIIKWIDTSIRMRVLNKRMDGLILISHYLDNYYQDCNRFRMPPTTDIEDSKWNVETEFASQNKITLLYAGSPGRGDKDRLENLLQAIGTYNNLSLSIVGISKEMYCHQFPQISIPKNVRFLGHLPHEMTISLLNKSDFSVFFREPSRVNNAGFPTKFVEAQTSGIPVISNMFSDLNDYLEDGKNGFLAESISLCDVERVLFKVSQLNSEQVREMKQYTKSFCHFDFRQYIDSFTQFIDSI